MNHQQILTIPGKLIESNPSLLTPTSRGGVSLGAIKVLNHPVTPEAVVNRADSSLGDQNFIDKVFLHPTAVSYYTQGAVNSSISVDVFGLFPSKWFPNIDTFNDSENADAFASFFTLHYDLILEFGSNYELIVYISFTQPSQENQPADTSEKDKELFKLLQFSIEFSPDAFDDFFSTTTQNGLPLINKIKTVKTFVVNQAKQTEYQKQFKATTVSIQNCPPESVNNNSDPFAIPGISLGLQSLSNESPELPYVSFIDSANPPSDNNFPILPVDDFLLSPLVSASHLGSLNPGGETLEVLIAALLQQSLGIINPSEFAFFYNVVLDNSTLVQPQGSEPSIESKYKMNLYMTFNKEELKGSTNVLDAFYFSAKFGDFQQKLILRHFNFAIELKTHFWGILISSFFLI